VITFDPLLPPIVHIAATADLPPPLWPRLRRFLDEAFDGDLSAADWRSALGGRHFWVEDDEGLLAHASLVPRVLVSDGRALLTGYVEAVATRKDARRRGFGALVMKSVGEAIIARYELGALSSNVDAFYERLGWEPWRGTTGVVRDLSELAGPWDPTPDDDGCIFVYRTPRTPTIDIDAPLLCEWREGDVW
jgi:aminoglycoside 2'-N-acetyltransferase I